MIAQIFSSANIPWDVSLLLIIYIFLTLLFITCKIIGIEIGVINENEFKN